MRSMRRVLQLPVYRRLLGAYALNELAWSIGTLALAFLVYARTNSALGATAFFLCSLFVPALVTPAVVARLDQRTPRHVLPALYALEGLAFLALAWIASNFSLGPVLILTAIDGVIALVARSLARAPTVDVTASADLLREGNAVNNAAFSVCFMAGPAIGGVISSYYSSADRPTLPYWKLGFADTTLRLLGSDDFAPDVKKRAAQELTVALVEGSLRSAIVERVVLADIARAHELVEGGVDGRVIVTVSEGA